VNLAEFNSAAQHMLKSAYQTSMFFALIDRKDNGNLELMALSCRAGNLWCETKTQFVQHVPSIYGVIE
jgi:hypothetical protein